MNEKLHQTSPQEIYSDSSTRKISKKSFIFSLIAILFLLTIYIFLHIPFSNVNSDNLGIETKVPVYVDIVFVIFVAGLIALAIGTVPAKGWKRFMLFVISILVVIIFFSTSLDLYIITSREEGGPKAILESMACGVPLVTTRVGQAMDMVKHNENGMMTNTEDYQGLAFYAQEIISNSQLREKVIRKGYATAEQNTYSAHLPLWQNFFEDFAQSN